MMNKNIFCGRKDGVTRNGVFYRHPRTSEILAKEIERQSNKMMARRLKKES